MRCGCLGWAFSGLLRFGHCVFLSIENMSSVDYSQGCVAEHDAIYFDDHSGLFGIVDPGGHYRFILCQVFQGHGEDYF